MEPLPQTKLRQNRVLVYYRLVADKPKGEPRPRRERVCMRVKPRTRAIVKNCHLAGWGLTPTGKHFIGQAVDAMVRRYWQKGMGLEELPPNDWGTLTIIDEMLHRLVKKKRTDLFRGQEYVWLHPNRGRLLDAIADFWYKHKGTYIDGNSSL